MMREDIEQAVQQELSKGVTVFARYKEGGETYIQLHRVPVVGDYVMVERRPRRPVLEVTQQGSFEFPTEVYVLLGEEE